MKKNNLTILLQRSLGRNKYCFALLALIVLLIAGCKKSWLDKKPDNSQVILSTLPDYEALMNNIFFYTTVYLGGSMTELGSDDFYLTQSSLASQSADDQQRYIWYPAEVPITMTDWVTIYPRIYTCNVAIDGLNRIERTASNSQTWDQVYGRALFFRALEYSFLAQSFMKLYDSTSAQQDLGVPLRLTPSIAEPVGRASVQQVYNQILADLQQASILLFTGPQPYQETYYPTKAAAFSVLARVYLVMGDYTDAKANAELALKYNSTLLDYNNISNSGNPGLKMPPWYQNPEVNFYAGFFDALINPSVARIDTQLYKTYSVNDLRRSLFFDTTQYNPEIVFSGSYGGLVSLFSFSAPAVDELYLIRAECNARLGNTDAAIADINALLVKRYRKNTYSPYTATTADDALRLVLQERRKELVMRGTRWSDLRRLNKDPRFQTTVTRILNGQSYSLTPNSNLYTWPIPLNEVSVSGIPQNPR